MALQDEINALTARLNAVVAQVNALPGVTPGPDLTALTAEVTAVEQAVAAKTAAPTA